MSEYSYGMGQEEELETGGVLSRVTPSSGKILTMHEALNLLMNKMEIGEGLYSQIRKVNASSHADPVTPPTKEELRSALEQIVANTPRTRMAISEPDLKAMRKSIGDVLFYQFLRRTPIMTGTKGAAFIEEFWENYGKD